MTPLLPLVVTTRRWLDEATVAQVLAAHGRLPEFALATLTALTDDLAVAARRLLQDIGISASPRDRPVLIKRLTAIADSAACYAQRVGANHSPGRQYAALRQSLRELPPILSQALADAAMPEGNAAEGMERLAAMVAAILPEVQLRVGMNRGAAIVGAEQLGLCALLALQTWRDARIPWLNKSQAARDFAVAALAALHAHAGIAPTLTRRTETHDRPGAPDGRSLHLLRALFDAVRTALASQVAPGAVDRIHLLKPTDEMLAEWVCATQGKPQHARRSPTAWREHADRERAGRGLPPSPLPGF